MHHFNVKWCSGRTPGHLPIVQPYGQEGLWTPNLVIEVEKSIYLTQSKAT